MHGDTFPRLTDLAYIEEGLLLIKNGATFESLRLRLIDVSRKRAQVESDIPRSGYGVSRRLAVVDEYTYWSNAKDVLIELMNLGMMKDAPVPSKRIHVSLNRTRSYELTELGKESEALLEHNEAAFRERLLQLMYGRHEHLRNLIRTLEQRDLIIPVYRLEEEQSFTRKPGDVPAASEVTSWISKKASAFNIMNLKIETIERELQEKASKADSKSKWVSAINEYIESVFLSAYGLKFDNVTFEHAFRLGQQFHVMNYGYLRTKDTLSLVVFSTAEISEKPVFEVHRHRLSDLEEKLVVAIATEYDAIGEAFVPIHDLRTRVCLKLKCNDELFDFVLGKLFSQGYKVDFQINLLRDMPGVLPPSAKPLRIGNSMYFTLAILRKMGV
jgi:hypothetical protein